MEFDDVADELYEVTPEEFVALRKQRQDQAKADGDKALAKEIGALPKPSAAAWACNLLVREHRAEIEDLVELGDLLREAQENLAGDQLRALDVQRRQLVTALTRQARGLTAGREHPVSTAVATQVEETLRAAMADPDAGLATRPEENTTCCYAVQDKVWVTGPGGEPWEVYTVTGDARPDLDGKTAAEPAPACC